MFTTSANAALDARLSRSVDLRWLTLDGGAGAGVAAVLASPGPALPIAPLFQASGAATIDLPAGFVLLGLVEGRTTVFWLAGDDGDAGFGPMTTLHVGVGLGHRL